MTRPAASKLSLATAQRRNYTTYSSRRVAELCLPFDEIERTSTMAPATTIFRNSFVVKILSQIDTSSPPKIDFENLYHVFMLLPVQSKERPHGNIYYAIK